MVLTFLAMHDSAWLADCGPLGSHPDFPGWLLPTVFTGTPELRAGVACPLLNVLTLKKPNVSFCTQLNFHHTDLPNNSLFSHPLRRIDMGLKHRCVSCAADACNLKYDICMADIVAMLVFSV